MKEKLEFSQRNRLNLDADSSETDFNETWQNKRKPLARRQGLLRGEGL